MKRTTRNVNVDFSWQTKNMSVIPLFVTTQNTMQPRYTQRQVVYLGVSQKSLDFTKTNVEISCYIERVIIFTQNINKAKKFEDKSNVPYYENISYFHCTFSGKERQWYYPRFTEGVECSKEVLRQKYLKKRHKGRISEFKIFQIFLRHLRVQIII